jgi:deoxyribodipyrimidine photolyase-related protein
MLGLVFPHQCFKEIPAEWKEIWFIRHDIGYGGKQTTVRDFHVARKIFLRAAEKAWISNIKRRYPGVKIRIVDRRAASSGAWKTTDACEAWDPVDHMLEAEIRRRCPKVAILPTPAFLLSAEEAATILGHGAKHSHQGFYGEMRRRTGILMTKEGKPEGGRLRFDDENRERVGAGVKIPDWDREIDARESREAAKWVDEAAEEIKQEGGGIGSWIGTSIFPVSHEDAEKALDRFLRGRLAKFGPYQDAIIEEDDFLFHSVLSAPINAGLLTPTEVLEAAVRYGKAHSSVPLASLEGFVAQILGWREYMRAIYVVHPKPPANRLGHRRRLSMAWYKGTTGLLPVDTAIQRVQENAYLHHIERLMVVGNAMFLCEIQPTEVYRWFMEMFADSYDWVMIGNVFYMSQWGSDAMTTKPYISSSAYLLRMSDYKRGPWADDWDALYWGSIARHAALIRKNYRMAAQVSFWEKKSASDKAAVRRRVSDVLGRL